MRFFGEALKGTPMELVATMRTHLRDSSDVTALTLANAFFAYEGQHRTERALEAIR